MKRLLQSYKFYGAVFGTAAAFVGAGVFELDTTVITMVVGLWASLIAGQTVKDFQIEKYKNNDTPKPTVGGRPDDRD